MAEKNEKMRKIAKVRNHLLDATMELGLEEINIAKAIIEIGTNIVINNQ